eukprot:471677_1
MAHQVEDKERKEEQTALTAWLFSNGLNNPTLINVLKEQEIENAQDLLEFTNQEIKSVLLNRVPMGKIAKLIRALNQYRTSYSVHNQPLQNEQNNEQQIQPIMINWNNVKKLDLTNGSGGGAGKTTYTARGIRVEIDKPVLYFKPNTSYYHIGYMFSGDITTCHPSNQPAGYCGNGHRATFWLSSCKENILTFTFPQTTQLSYINMYINIGANWCSNAKYSIDILRDNKWKNVSEMIDTTNDAFGVARSQQIRQAVDGIRFNLKTNGSYVAIKEMDFFVVK